MMIYSIRTAYDATMILIMTVMGSFGIAENTTIINIIIIIILIIFIMIVITVIVFISVIIIVIIISFFYSIHCKYGVRHHW